MRVDGDVEATSDIAGQCRYVSRCDGRYENKSNFTHIRPLQTTIWPPTPTQMNMLSSSGAAWYKESLPSRSKHAIKFGSGELEMELISPGRVAVFDRDADEAEKLARSGSVTLKCDGVERRRTKPHVPLPVVDDGTVA